MKMAVVIAALAGLAIATGIVGYIGFDAVFAAVSTIGWRGLAVLSVYSLVPLALLGSAWFVVGDTSVRSHWAVFVWARAVRDAGSELLPFSHVGGFVMGARAAIVRGVTPTAAYSTTIVDVTTEILAQLGFTGIGLGLLLQRLSGADGAHGGLIVAVAVGLALTGLGAAAMIAVQRRGGGLAEALAARFLPGAAERTGRVIRALNALYDTPGRIAAGVAFHLAAWVASALGVWLALHLAGVAIDLADVLAIESLVAAARSAAFVAPMGIGVQEASYAVIGPLFGLGPDLSLALSLLKRARDLAVGLPALLSWQAMEGARLVGKPARAPEV